MSGEEYLAKGWSSRNIEECLFLSYELAKKRENAQQVKKN